MRARLYLTLLYTLASAHHARSLPNQVLFRATQAHESTLAADDTPQTVFTPLSEGTYNLRTRTQTVHQPRDVQDVYRVRDRSLRLQESEPIEWVKKEVLAPDVTDRVTLQELAKMTANAYAQPGKPNWWNMTAKWNTSFPFGWEPDEDGFRGHVFVSEDENIVVMSIKGTSLWTPVGDKTSKKDKLNDNLVSHIPNTLAPTHRPKAFLLLLRTSGLDMGATNCVRLLYASLVLDSLFYNVGLGLFMELRGMYPDANIWLTGHSLGGALAALLGATFGVPTVTFESPGERLASTRLHIPTPPGIPSSDLSITHVWHTGDPIPDGRCVGPTSLCAKGGYALETRCRNGKHIVYDTVTRKKWAPSIARHRIGVIIQDILGEDWEEDRAVPEAVPYDDCEECAKWMFGDYK